VTDHYRLEAAIVTVDAQHAMATLAAHPEVAKQIAVADRLVVTKLDLLPFPAELMIRLKQLNPGAAIVESRAGAAALAAFARSTVTMARGFRCRMPDITMAMRRM
ncbi:MAG: GTP-binding protein, partial [Pseudomonadota bacterium]